MAENETAMLRVSRGLRDRINAAKGGKTVEEYLAGVVGGLPNVVLSKGGADDGVIHVPELRDMEIVRRLDEILDAVKKGKRVEEKVITKVPDRCLDSLVLEFREDGNRKVVSEPGWVKAVEWAVSWWEGKI
jgi:hypothetical protein